MHKVSHLFRLTHTNKSLSSWCHGTVRYRLMVCTGTVRLKLCQQSMMRWPLCKKTSGLHELIPQACCTQGLPTDPVFQAGKPLFLRKSLRMNNLSVMSVLIRVQKTHSSSLRLRFVCQTFWSSELSLHVQLIHSYVLVPTSKQVNHLLLLTSLGKWLVLQSKEIKKRIHWIMRSWDHIIWESVLTNIGKLGSHGWPIRSTLEPSWAFKKTRKIVKIGWCWIKMSGLTPRFLVVDWCLNIFDSEETSEKVGFYLARMPSK